MQFYLFFPLILLLMARTGLVLGSMLLIIATGLFAAAFPGFLASFPEPAFLGLKLQLFLAGMLIMRARIDQKPRLLLPAIILAVIPIGSLPHWSELVVRVLLALVLIVALSDKSSAPSLRAANALMERTLGGGGGRFLGDISYGVYLIHLPVLIVILSSLLGLPPFPRAIAGFALAVLPVTLLAWLGFRLVEKPGIDLGRKLLSEGSRQVPSTPPMT
jgi:peptidoglycan/LPS O-acetylase OafA/YrhL